MQIHYSYKNYSQEQQEQDIERRCIQLLIIFICYLALTLLSHLLHTDMGGAHVLATALFSYHFFGLFRHFKSLLFLFFSVCNAVYFVLTLFAFGWR